MGKARKSVKSYVGGGRFGAGLRSSNVGPRALAEQRVQMRDRIARTYEGLGPQSLQALQDMAPDDHLSDFPGNDVFMQARLAAESDDSYEDEADYTQGTDASQSIVMDMAAIIANGQFNRYRTGQKRKATDGRTWKNRIRQLDKNWEPLIPNLTAAYIQWRYNNEPSNVITYMEPNVYPAVDGWDFDIDVLDLFTLARVAVIPRDGDTPAATALINAGYLGTTPLNPSIAVSLRTLDLFYTIRLFRPSFSVEAFSKVICHTLSMPYRRGYRTALSDAFDIYIILRRNVDAQVARELKQDTENYRVLHSCPPCNYEFLSSKQNILELKDETPLRFKRMFAMDGNNSLKRMKGIGSRQVSDTRIFGDGDYFLSEDYVNKFADEVSSKRSAAEEAEDNPSDRETSPDNEGDPTDASDASSSLRRCAENWKAAASDSKKKMWDIFHESGIFASACRHGFILWITDMIRSGELAKYPLAIIAKALEVLGGGWLVGYDIGCSFSSTIDHTSLSEDFQKQGCQICVNAFHGYSHNALCQQTFHPNNIVGMGLEDLETMERIFSLSNQLASVTRYMSAFRRRVFIDLFFQQWDRDKYASLATMLFNNYRQALDIIHTDAKTLKDDLATLNLTEAEIEGWWVDQEKHFVALGVETAQDVSGVVYVELLQKLRALEASLEQSQTSFRVEAPEDFVFLSQEASYSSQLSETRKTETRQRYLKEQRDKVLFEVIQMETLMDTPRWTPLDPRYQAALKYMKERTYFQKLEALHKLIVQRLFEMHKMNISQTGYKMRTHISTALQRRSKAIRSAVAAYNKAALALEPPRDTLDWTKVTHFSFIDQFDILRDTRHSVLEKEWAKPLNRELMMRLHRVARAREEIEYLNRDLRRLHTSIVDEEKHFTQMLEQLKGNSMFGPVEDHISRRRAVNKLLLTRIHATYALPGFTGNPTPGEHVSCSAPEAPQTHTHHPSSSSGTSEALPPTGSSRQSAQLAEDDSDNEGANDDDDEFTTGIHQMVDFVSNLSVQ